MPVKTITHKSIVKSVDLRILPFKTTMSFYFDKYFEQNINGTVIAEFNINWFWGSAVFVSTILIEFFFEAF